MKTLVPSKRTHALLLIIFVLISAALAFPSADTRPVAARISEILVKFPAQTPAEKEALAAEIIALGETGIEEICRRLVPAGKADDSLVRYALEAAGTYVMRPAAEGERRLYARAVIKALLTVPDSEVKAFLISRLQASGGREALHPLVRYLNDPKLGDPAIQALLSIRPPGIEKALIQALDRKAGANKLALIQALGEIRSLAAVEKIIPFASSRDQPTRDAALFALANIGDPRAERVLNKIPVALSPMERARAVSRYLLFALRAAEAGRREDAVKSCRDIIEKSTGSEEGQVRSAALALLTELRGAEALTDLLQAMDSPDAAYRERALELSLSLPGEEAAARWIERAGEVSHEARAQIIAMLGRRSDKAALPFIKESLKSEAKAVRLGAIFAIARIGGSEVMTDLCELWQSADEEEADVLKGVFLTFPSAAAVAATAGIFDGASPSGKAAILALLGERGAAEYAGIVLSAAASDNEPIRKSALAALEKVARAQDLAQIMDLLSAAAEPAEILALQNALVAAAGQLKDPESRADAILEKMHQAQGSKRLNLMRPLARVGGENALKAVLAEIQNPDSQVQAVAMYTLANWTEFRAVPELRKVAAAADGSAGRRFVYLALQGYVRLVHESDLPAEKKLEFIKNVLSFAREPAEKNIIIAGLGGIKNGESLLLISPFLDDPAFREKAAQAALRAALPSPGFEGLFGLDTARTLKRAAKFIQNEYDRGEAEKYAHELLLREGFRPLFNGKDLSGWKGLVKDPPSRARMTPQELRKEQAAADIEMKRHWQVIDGALVFDGQGQSLCSAQDFADFELFVDWKIEPGGDSGIYLRGSPQVQVWDPAEHAEGSGGLYNNKIGPAAPLQAADNPAGEWNTFEILMSGDRVTVYLNGVLVVDNINMENTWERNKPIYPAGQIELQAHSTPLYFKNIYIREIPGSQPIVSSQGF
jgi:HEAT repeat protein